MTTLAKLANTKVCFVAGTMVHTLEGLKPIEQLVKGDLVLTRSEFAGSDDRSVAYRPVVGTIVTQPVELVHLEVTADDGRTETISTTPVHPFFVVEHRGFVHAGKLNAGDSLSLPEGRSAMVASVRRETSDPGTSFTTYNIEVEEMHTYFVGKMGVWVHNASELECLKATAHFLNLQKAGKLSPAELRERIIDWFREKVAKGELSVESALKHIDDTLEEVGLPKAGGSIDLTPKGIAPNRIPHGFGSEAEFNSFAKQLNEGLANAGHGETKALFQGSSVTGKKFTTGEPFDVGRVSDFDIALADPKLLARAKELGIALRSSGTRTGPLSVAELEKLGLKQLAEQLSRSAGGREINFMIFESAEAAAARAASIGVPK